MDMDKGRIEVTVDVEKLRQVAEAFQWFAGRLSAAADELYEALRDRPPSPTKDDVRVAVSSTPGGYVLIEKIDGQWPEWAIRAVAKEPSGTWDAHGVRLLDALARGDSP